LRQFFVEVAAAKRGDKQAQTIRTPARRAREIEAARQQLARSGI
jgi:hypothetical protein